jgi:hypothetical protein
MMWVDNLKRYVCRCILEDLVLDDSLQSQTHFTHQCISLSDVLYVKFIIHKSKFKSQPTCNELINLHSNIVTTAKRNKGMWFFCFKFSLLHKKWLKLHIKCCVIYQNQYHNIVCMVQVRLISGRFIVGQFMAVRFLAEPICLDFRKTSFSVTVIKYFLLPKKSIFHAQLKKFKIKS